MKICPQCKNELRDEAKFCTKCGTKCAAASEAVCAKCGNALRPGAKFCNKCGTPAAAAAPAPVQSAPAQPPAQKKAPEQSDARVPGLERMGSSIHWNILKGQLAVKINEDDIAAYGNGIKAIDIQEGVKALLFIHGKLIGELPSGHYPFSNWQNQPKQEKTGLLKTFWNWVTGLFPSKPKEDPEKDSAYPIFSFVLIRTNEFPLVYSFPNIRTATVSCDIGAHLLCKIDNINDFYNSLLLAQKSVSFEQIARELEEGVKTQFTYAFTGIDPEKIHSTPGIADALLDKLQAVVGNVYPFIKLSRVINISAANEDLENFRRMSEELYVSERELAELVKRNDFLNRLTSVENEQILTALRAANTQTNALDDINYAQEEHSTLRETQHDVAMQSLANSREMTELRMSTSHDLEGFRVTADYEAAKEKIYEEMALTEDERAKFDLMLAAQRTLREARTQEDLAVAMQEFRKSGLLREEEIENLQHQITHNAQLRDLNAAQVLSMATMQNQMALDQQKLEWEIQIGNRRIQNHFDRQRIEDAYNDERRNSEYAFFDERRDKDAAFSDSRRDADAAYADSRRRANLELDRQEMDNQLEQLKRAQAIRMEREDSEHRREMESTAAAYQHELDTQRLTQEGEKTRLDAANEEKRIFSTMTFEQIMAANPNLTPQAAQALAKKYEAEAEAAKAQTAMAQNDRIAQMALDQKDQMMSFMQQQMAMMKELSMAGINAGAGHQQAMLDAKQAELDRTRADAAANSDRFVDGMKTTIQSVGNMGRPEPQAQAQPQVQPQIQIQPAYIPVQAVAAAPAVNQTVKCPKCNCESPAGEAFCSECGTSL